MGPSVVLVHIIVVAPSPSSFHPVSVVVSSVIPSRRGSSRRFIRHPQRVPFPFARRYSFRRRSAPRLVVSSVISSPAVVLSVVSSPAVVLSVVVLPHRAPFRLLVARRLVPRPVVRSVVPRPSSRRSFRSSFVGSFVLPVSRHDGRGVFSFDSEAGKQARGRGGAWDSDGRGAISEGRGKQAGEMGGGQI